MKTGDIVRQYRVRKLNMTARRASELLGVHPVAFCHWESGFRSPDLNAIRLMIQSKRFQSLGMLLITEIPGLRYDRN